MRVCDLPFLGICARGRPRAGGARLLGSSCSSSFSRLIRENRPFDHLRGLTEAIQARKTKEWSIMSDLQITSAKSSGFFTLPPSFAQILGNPPPTSRADVICTLNRAGINFTKPSTSILADLCFTSARFDPDQFFQKMSNRLLLYRSHQNE